MKFIENAFDKVRPQFEKGGKWEKLWPVFEAAETFHFVKPDRTQSGAHIRDHADTKRMMSIVIVALLPCFLFGMYNVGVQHFLAIGQEASLTAKVLFGARYVMPIVIVSYAVGGIWELLFCIVRKHEVNEGFLVTGLLFPLTLPPTIPLWLVAVGVSFGVVIGKEVFGGTGMNVFNPALTARALVFFAYADKISGEGVWTKLVGDQTFVDGYSGATPLLHAAGFNTASIAEQAAHVGLEPLTRVTDANVVIPHTQAALDGMSTMYANMDFSWMSMFIGTIPGSIGEVSTLACLIGALILIATGVGSWRIMLSCALGVAAMSAALHLGAEAFFPANPDGKQVVIPGMFMLPPHYHFVMGGLMFGLVFMTTDPVSAAHTKTGKWIYGFLIGVLVVIIRVINPAFPEGMMLAILFMNAFSPLIDYFVVQGNIKRRLARVQAA